MSEPLPLGHLGSILSPRVILMMLKPALSSAIDGPQQLCFRNIHTWHPSACHPLGCVWSSWLVLLGPGHGCAVPSPCQNEISLLAVPNLGLGRSVMLMYYSWEETREKQQAAHGHGVSQHLKTQWDSQNCLHSGRWGSREDITFCSWMHK